MNQKLMFLRVRCEIDVLFVKVATASPLYHAAERCSVHTDHPVNAMKG